MLLFFVLQMQFQTGFSGNSLFTSSSFQSQAALASTSSNQITETAFASIDRDEYCLGVGDLLLVTIEGGLTEHLYLSGLSPMEQCGVTLDGFINVSGIGSIEVAGQSINEAQTSLTSLVRSYYPYLHACLTLQHPRQVQINLRGMVVSPGMYTFFATSRVSDLFYAGGGSPFFGSHLGIAVTADGDSLAIDLSFDAFTNMLRLDPLLGNLRVVEFFAVTNPLFVNKRNSISVIDINPEGETLSDVLYKHNLISGNINLLSSTVNSRDHRTTPILTSDGFGFSVITLMPYDTLNFSHQEISIFVSGAVNQPGMVPYNPLSGVDWYIQAAGGFRNDASRSNIVIQSASGFVEDANLDTYIIQPNSTIEVKYSWISSNSQYISLFVTFVALSLSVINLLQ